MNLAQNIRRLRLARGMTQAALAEHLGVSDRAVSRWERGVASPDITLLPQLALVLETSADALLGLDPLRIQTEILHATEECTALLRRGDTASAVTMLREKTARYPNEPELMVYLARALLALKTGDAVQEALALCRRAGEQPNSGVQPLRLSSIYGCRQVMALALKRLGREEQAVQLVSDELPAIWVCRELMLARVAPPELAQRARESNVHLLAGLLADTLEQLGRTADARSIREICQL